MMPSSCPECGSTNVVQDEFYSQTQWVCEDCGSLISEGKYTTDYRDEQHSREIPRYVTTEQSKKLCPNQLKGLIRVKSLCRILRFSRDMEEGAVDLFNRAYNHPNFLRAHMTKKEALGACCVLSMSRQNNWPISIGTISNLAQTDPAFVGVIFKELNKSMGIEVNTLSVTDMLESYCQGYKLGPGEVADMFAEPPQRLLDRSAALMEVATDAWLVTGRHPQPLLMACVYVAWQSLNPIARMKCSMNKFCQIGRLSKDTCVARKDTAVRRVGELRDVLCKLGRQLPWLRGGAVEPNNVAKLVDDILKHRQALLLKAMASHEEELERELCNTHDAKQAEAETESAVPPQPPLTGTLPQCHQPSGKDTNQSLMDCPPVQNCSFQQAQPAGTRKKPAESTLPPAGEVYWGKRHLFVPPSARTEKRPRLDTSEPNVTGDEEISDSEIELYIRSPEEMMFCSAAQKKLKEGH